MSFVFGRRFYILLALGLVPLSISWSVPILGTVVILYDVLLIAAAALDIWRGRGDRDNISINRQFDHRFAVGDVNEVLLVIENGSTYEMHVRIKDEYPPDLRLREIRETQLTIEPNGSHAFGYEVVPPRRGSYTFGTTAVRIRSPFGLVWTQADLASPNTIKVYPNIRRAREMELKALGARSFMAVQRRAVRRGEGREFESMRDYVRGDELRHVSWTATARRSKLTTRQYQIERDQTVIIALDAGRLMTGRIEDETKFETALHASLALMLACNRAGDNCGLVVFGRKVLRYLPPKRGPEHIDAVLEALHDLEPEMIEPSYGRALRFISSNLKKRAFVVMLTDVVDKDSSKELISSLKLLRPRHLPLVATIGDRDLNAVVAQQPHEIKSVFLQSAAEEIIHQRVSALRAVESLGGLALDVTSKTLAPRLLETYLRVKERGML